jgi:hypothetical protein
MTIFLFEGNTESNHYNEEVFHNNMRYAILDQLANPPQGFEDVVQAHFYIRRQSLIRVGFAASCAFYNFPRQRRNKQ